MDKIQNNVSLNITNINNDQFGKLPPYDFSSLMNTFLGLFALHILNFILLYCVSNEYFNQFNAWNDHI